MRRERRGSYNAILGLLLPVSVGLAALSVDISWMRLAESQSQDVADAAAHAALIQLRRTGSTASARAVADVVTGRNTIGEQSGRITDVEFGGWTRDDGAFVPSDRPNAVRVRVGREGSEALPLHFAPIFGRTEAEVSSGATAAARSLHVVLVMDITGSFRNDIHHARDGAVTFLDTLSTRRGDDDHVGMVTFFNRYGHRWTPMIELADEGALGTVELQWASLTWCHSEIDWDGPASPPKPWKSWGGLSWRNNSPQMPACWGDEGGTDHSVGMRPGVDMLLELDDPFAYRAMIVLTDGEPASFSGVGRRRPTTYVDPWARRFESANSRSSSNIQRDSRAQSDRADDNDIHVWTISYGGYGQASFMESLIRGDGKAYATTNAADLEPIFKEIAQQMPMLIVR